MSQKLLRIKCLASEVESVIDLKTEQKLMRAFGPHAWGKFQELMDEINPPKPANVESAA